MIIKNQSNVKKSQYLLTSWFILTLYQDSFWLKVNNDKIFRKLKKENKCIKNTRLCLNKKPITCHWKRQMTLDWKRLERRRICAVLRILLSDIVYWAAYTNTSDSLKEKINYSVIFFYCCCWCCCFLK